MRILLLVLLGCSLAEGLLSKCPLRKELLRRRVNNQVDENLLAQSEYSLEPFCLPASVVPNRSHSLQKVLWFVFESVLMFGNAR